MSQADYPGGPRNKHIKLGIFLRSGGWSRLKIAHQAPIMGPRPSAMTFREAARMIPPSAEHPRLHFPSSCWSAQRHASNVIREDGLTLSHQQVCRICQACAPLTAIPVSRIGCLVLPCLSQPRQLNRFRLHEPCLRANSCEHIVSVETDPGERPLIRLVSKIVTNTRLGATLGEKDPKGANGRFGYTSRTMPCYPSLSNRWTSWIPRCLVMQGLRTRMRRCRALGHV